MSRLKRVPAEVKTEPLLRPTSDSERSLGISLKVPEHLREMMRQEILRTVLKPTEESLLKDLVEELGFVLLDLTLTKEQLSSLPGIEVQNSERNHLPLLWHKDGGIKQLASFSALFTDVYGPRRLSNTVISEATSVFPSLIKSCGEIISRLKKNNAPEEFIAAWKKAKSKLKTIVSTSDPEPSRQLSIRFSMDYFLNALELCFQKKYLNYKDYNKILNDSISFASDRVYVHEWGIPQTLIISSKGEFVHCRKPSSKTKTPEGNLFVKAVLEI